MKIQNITNIYNPFKFNGLNNKNYLHAVSNPFINNGLTADIVSFSGKAYSADSIENLTNHCAYCGCKVYNDSQLDSLAKEMLRDSSHRLSGDIKSVLEKLETAERSYELTVAKQMENKKEIEFYKKFLEQAEDKSWLKGEAIFQQVYKMEPEEAFVALKKNMRPLTRTIDHVSPQKLAEDNKDDEINLVEACYCCNHDIKGGLPFPEFYTMYPTIKENMPADKFKYAHAKLLASSESILSKVSATKLIKYVSGLFEQRTRAVSQLNNVDFRISESEVSVANSIKSCSDEIEEKEAQIFDLKTRLSEISDDPEYKAMIKRVSLLQIKSDVENSLAELRDKRQNTSNAINDLKNPPKKGKKAKISLSQDQKEQKIAAYKLQLIDLKTQIEEKEVELAENALKMSELDEQYPTIEMLQSRKNSYDQVINAYSQLSVENSKFDDLTKISTLQAFDIAKLEKEIDSLPKDAFDISKYPQDEQAIYTRFTSLLDALKYLEQHSNGSGVKSVINQSAKIQIEQELEECSKYPVIVEAKNHLKKKELTAQLDKIKDDKQENDKNILISKNKINQLQKITSRCSLEEAKKQTADISVWIRRLNDKENYLQIPKTIEKLEAEIILLRSAIADLTSKQNQISALNIKQP